MAHHIKIEIVPHKNKDGRFSKTKQDYQVIDVTRGKRIVVGVASSRSGAVEMGADHREKMIQKHHKNHPNDLAFQRKVHGSWAGEEPK